jgi:DNA repair protein RadC
LILGSQKQADALLRHFGSLTVLARASVKELLPFVSRPKAMRLVSSLRMGAVALREERESLTIDSPLAIADLCSEMRFLDREYLRVVLLNAKQHLIKVVTVSQGSVNESLAHPREVFKPAIVHSAYSFIMVHNHPSGAMPYPVLCRAKRQSSRMKPTRMRHKNSSAHKALRKSSS